MTTTSERALVTARRPADGRDTELSAFQAVPEPIRVRDPWQVAAGVETARALAGLGGVGAIAASGDPTKELAAPCHLRRGATGCGRDGV